MRVGFWQRGWWPYILLLVLVLALGLRLYRIEAQSFWNDEGTSVALAARSLAAITTSAAGDIHPPLYYYLLHFWIALLGNSELAVRSLSALMGTLLVLLTFSLGRLLQGWPSSGGLDAHTSSRSSGGSVGLLAALFAALSPFQVHYSQEARMYILSAALGAASMFAFLRLLANWQSEVASGARASSHLGRRGGPVAYVLATALLLYTHYFAASLILAQNLAFLGWWLLLIRQQAPASLPAGSGTLQARFSWRLLLRWAALQAMVCLAFLPWLLRVTGQLRFWPAISEPMLLHTLLLNLLRVFGLGLSVPPRLSIALSGLGALLLVGMFASVTARWRAGEEEAQAANRAVPLTLLLYLLVPIGMMHVLSLRRPMYDPKFLLLCTPPFHIFLAQGAVFLTSKAVGGHLATERAAGQVGQSPESKTGKWRRLPGLSSGLLLVCVAAVAIPSILSLQAYYFDPRYARDDYRGIAQYIAAVEREDDAVLINAPSQIETFAYYYTGALPVYPLPRQRPLDEAATEADLRQVMERRGRIFAVFWATDESDPTRFVEGWLDEHAYKAMDSWYGRIRLVAYALPAQTGSEVPTHAQQVNLGEQVLLLGYSLPTTEVMPGDILQLTLFWQSLAPMSERYKVFTHVLDGYGHLVGQRDAEPGGGAKITTIWEEGERIIDHYGLPILPATPPGDYAIEIGMYALSNGQRLPVIESGQSSGDHIVLRPVRVLPAAAPPPVSVLGMERQIDIRVGGVTLLGYDLARLGSEHEPGAAIRPGDILHLTLFWQAHDLPAEDLTLLLQLQDDKGVVRLERQAQPTEGQYPAAQWRAGEIIRDQHNWLLPADLAPGKYRIYLSVQGLPAGEGVAPRFQLATFLIS